MNKIRKLEKYFLLSKFFLFQENFRKIFKSEEPNERGLASQNQIVWRKKKSEFEGRSLDQKCTENVQQQILKIEKPLK